VVAECETDMAAAFGSKHIALVNSGTDALRFALLALGLGPGDEVITVPNTFIATTEAIRQCGAQPVFVDIDPVTYTMDPAQVAAAMTPRTRGILPVHLYGHPADLDGLLAIAADHGLWLVEDAAQAHGARYKGVPTGTFGAAAAYSFYPGKNLGACGEAGAVATDDAGLDGQVRRLRDHGQAEKYVHEIEGYNGRCDALQAAALAVKLPHLDTWREARSRIAKRYCEGLADVPDLVLPQTADWAVHAWHLYVIQVPQRDALAKALGEAGIGTGLHYPIPLHRQQAYADLGYGPGDFPVAEAMAERLLSLPLYPGMPDAAVEYVIEQVAKQCACLC
jgi:dTDP-4-amino-4,6-dideoxygalactose transaminase